MYSTYNYYPQQPTQQPTYQATSATNYYRQPMQSGLRGRPVSSLEEARASTIDFDGSIFYFPDLANKRIYTKQINMDGTSTLNMYELRDVPLEHAPAQDNFVTREEFEAVISQLKSALVPAKTPEETAQPHRQEILQF